MWSLKERADHFLAHLTDKERVALHNELLAVNQIVALNQQTSFYAFGLLKKDSRPHYLEERKRVLQYCNGVNEELIIHQIHRQHLFKHTYCFRVYFDLVEMDASFIDILLERLHNVQSVQSWTPKFA
ncbi:hypothetical protein [Enterococcus sp. RIT-PI-f]|uniref:hypothetical protein n=1 Tax=Enterococcus sp. RIT-PI-f TaxID=1690244 RepID=UPI0006B96338|nr:hypothetical protein [Enterococcus sp. RIT-PI-f]KPG69616.1 hypothetical protein AEQ18_13030 [Enterococcus sp. RIT-PI-f]